MNNVCTVIVTSTFNFKQILAIINNCHYNFVYIDIHIHAIYFFFLYLPS